MRIFHIEACQYFLTMPVHGVDADIERRGNEFFHTRFPGHHGKDSALPHRILSFVIGQPDCADELSCNYSASACPDGDGFEVTFSDFKVTHLPDKVRTDWLLKNAE